jgi:hypothetical protein
MPMRWRRIAWFTSFAVAMLLAVWMRGAGYGWLATLGAAFAIWVILPFVISQVCAVLTLGRMHRQLSGTDELVKKIAEATKGLSPEEQVEVGKRIIDETFK